MEKIYQIKAIYEDDYGCEERPEDYEPQVIAVLEYPGEPDLVIRQEDAWLYAQNMQEGDMVTLRDEKLSKIQ